MNYLPITLQELRYLVAVADHQHFGKAAKACNVSQPALSIQLKKLEEQLDVQLIERTNRSIQLTPVGHQVVKRARKVLEESYNIVDIARSSCRPFHGPIHMGVIPTVGPYFLPQILPAMKTAFPEMQLFLTEDKTENLLLALHEGKLDVLLMAMPVNDTNVETISVGHEPFYLAMHQDNPLAAKEIIDPLDLDKADLLLLTEGHCLREHALEACARFGVKERTDFHATSLETLKHMVAAGTGITLLPELSTDNLPNDVVIRPLARPVPTREIAVFYRKSSARHVEFEKLAKVIANNF